MLLFISRSRLAALALINIFFLSNYVFANSKLTLTKPTLSYIDDVKPVLEYRCAVCHGCYDAPCQIKFTSLEGLYRGAHKDNVYNTKRIISAKPTRLNIDAHNTEQWREKDFFNILPKGFDQANTPLPSTQNPPKDLGLIYKTLQHKQNYDLNPNQALPKSIPVGVSKKHACPNSDEYDDFAKDNPNWGMPYGLPPLNLNDQDRILTWIKQGANADSTLPIPPREAKKITQWENLLNQTDNKSQLIARYIYEHLFLSALYFEQYDQADKHRFYRIVRSSTPTGSPVKIIATRRPFDDPKTDIFYYRIIANHNTVISKNHAPYLLDETRLKKWNMWFYEHNFSVNTLPNFDAKSASNPFLTFAQIPVNSRYRFLLDESRYFIMNFIKGPVCRGQVAVNVIHDHFWVFFVNPEHTDSHFSDDFLSKNYKQFKLPNSDSSEFTPLLMWSSYADNQKEINQSYQRYLVDNKYKIANLNEQFIWNGDQKNPNSALTIFRHFDNAQVEYGLLGGIPHTAWLIDYPLLERIYYLLVANYDVYGNVAHQVISRVYMDFLRMDGERKFLQLLPQKQRLELRDQWYKGANSKASEYLSYKIWDKNDVDIFNYTSTPSKSVLLKRLKSHVNQSLQHKSVIKQNHNHKIYSLSHIQNAGFQYFDDVSIIKVQSLSQTLYFTLIKNVAHKNVSTMFDESDQIEHNKTHFIILKGVWGSYPNAFYKVEDDQLSNFINAFQNVKDKKDYLNIRKEFGVRRTSPQFWLYSDRLHTYLKQQNLHEYGLLDYNRLTSD